MGRWIWDGAMAIGAGILAAFLLTAAVMPVRVDGTSMEPTVSSGSWVLTNKVAYSGSQPQRGDLVIIGNVVFTEDGEAGRLLKRVVGLPGDRVEIRHGRLLVNDRDMTDRLCAEDEIIGDMETVVVKEDCVFVLGDNVNFSRDSRDETIGQLPLADVWGKAFFTIKPWEDFGPLGSSPESRTLTEAGL